MTRTVRRWLGSRAADPSARPGQAAAAGSAPAVQEELEERARATTLVLHIGLHKTASSYVQGLLSAGREALLREGVLYPRTGVVDKATASTREGAGSGQALFSRPGGQRALLSRLHAEMADGVSTVVVSSEEFARPDPRPTPQRLLARFRAFGTVKVVLVLRRQDDWIESYYKQVVDQFYNFETRSFGDYLRQEGPSLLDFHSRFTPWRDLVGPDNFHALSYDDLPGGAAICRRILEIAGVGGPVLDEFAAGSVPRYDSVRAIDTLGLRILNSYRLDDRDTRTSTARAIYDAAPAGDIELMADAHRAEVQTMCGPVNERIEAEWFAEPVPGFRFGAAVPATATSPPSGPETVDYVDRVITLCEHARGTLQPRAERGEDRT